MRAAEFSLLSVWLLVSPACTCEIDGHGHHGPAEATPAGDRRATPARDVGAAGAVTPAAPREAAAPTMPGSCEAVQIRPRIWRLTPRQIANTLADAFGFSETDIGAFPHDAVDPRTGFTDNADANFPGEQMTSAMLSLSEAVAGRFGAALAKDFP